MKPGIVEKLTTSNLTYPSLNFTKSLSPTKNRFITSTVERRTTLLKVVHHAPTIHTAFEIATGLLPFSVMVLIRRSILKTPTQFTRSGSMVDLSVSIVKRGNGSTSNLNQKLKLPHFVGTGIQLY